MRNVPMARADLRNRLQRYANTRLAVGSDQLIVKKRTGLNPTSAQYTFIAHRCANPDRTVCFRCNDYWLCRRCIKKVTPTRGNVVQRAFDDPVQIFNLPLSYSSQNVNPNTRPDHYYLYYSTIDCHHNCIRWTSQSYLTRID